MYFIHCGYPDQQSEYKAEMNVFYKLGSSEAFIGHRVGGVELEGHILHLVPDSASLQAA